MKTFTAESIINHSCRDIFNIFVKSAKLNFPNFKEKRAVGTYCNQKKNKRFKVEITAFEKDKLYEITSSNKRESCTTRYHLIPLSENETKIVFTEIESDRNVFGNINSFLTSLLLGKRQPDEFNTFIKNLGQSLEH
ncbi:DUF3284 domain-containing protein [uncultured Clostridium sp.]|uniref:DUF3284 domain-containing protein n=1 Tax=uncultured Clostridium sp. TaxID=59620 RepID=UPI0028E997B1|nr:DUF3284 domain-containing protein [uncultured Clostridium sp.]